MTLDQTLRKVRQPLMDGVTPDSELLGHFARLLELNHLESAKGSNHDADSQKWVGWLLPKAKQQGWIRQCVAQDLLPKGWLDWPRHDRAPLPKLKPVKARGKSARGVPGRIMQKKASSN